MHNIFFPPPVSVLQNAPFRDDYKNGSVCVSVRLMFNNVVFFFPLLQPISNADFIVPVEIDGTVHQVVQSKAPLHAYCPVHKYPSPLM